MTAPASCARNLPQHFNGCRCAKSPGGGEVAVELTTTLPRVYRAWVLDETTAYGNKVPADLDHNVLRPGTFLNVEVEGLADNESVRVEYDDSDTLKVMALMELDHEYGIREHLVKRYQIDVNDYDDWELSERHAELVEEADTWVAVREPAILAHVRDRTGAEDTDIVPPVGFRHTTYAWSIVIGRRGGLDDAVIAAEVIRGWNPAGDDSFYTDMFEKLDR